jgi:hypothetical protein
MKRKCAALGMLIVCAACGKVGNLEPRTAQSVPPKAYGQIDPQTAEGLTTPSVQARPGRSDELLRRSEKRGDDPFDLPPGIDPKPVETKPDGVSAPAKPK